jgi:hypothetical protein
MTLDEIAIKYGTDKSSLFHNYTVKYDKLLSQFREQFTNILEIGVQNGNSVKMWEEYFPNAVINGIDIDNNCKKYESERIKVTIADQGNESQLKELEKLGSFDFIVDDGSHIYNHQILTFQTLFPFLKKGGIYVIEDAVTSYWSGFGERPTCIEYFKNLIDDVNFHGRMGITPMIYGENGYWTRNYTHFRREDWQEALPEFESIHFMNSLILIYKRKLIRSSPQLL